MFCWYCFVVHFTKLCKIKKGKKYDTIVKESKSKKIKWGELLLAACSALCVVLACDWLGIVGVVEVTCACGSLVSHMVVPGHTPRKQPPMFTCFASPASSCKRCALCVRVCHACAVKGCHTSLRIEL